MEDPDPVFLHKNIRELILAFRSLSPYVANCFKIRLNPNTEGVEVACWLIFKLAAHRYPSIVK
jgi:hypothetical protein